MWLSNHVFRYMKKPARTVSQARRPLFGGWVGTGGEGGPASESGTTGPVLPESSGMLLSRLEASVLSTSVGVCDMLLLP